ncbi:ASCH domain-containing protein [Mesorhizobium retamae]|uniref:ASCH domain-containing protein n=1 Tax=Mesorhizobium retamae TaxID=2912854 RepID=A0ABS9QDK1_9HYPH|nr:ASCH domain-containing protein [Mesorhizobium sp. IRAMC:0171]MCG7505470.1 ASCH domain-containing protein [Mesorhizobium sp. IRAMC:0171]
MLFRQAILEAVARGDVTLAFRRWRRPTVKAGTGLRTAVGMVRIAAVEPIEEQDLTDAEAKAAGFADRAALLADLRSDGDRTLYRIVLDGIEPDQRLSLRGEAKLSEGDWHDLTARFARWDKAKPGYFPSILSAIGAHPGKPAGELARAAGVEKLKFKQDVRRLKELGLTESLEIGYRLSPRGEAVLEKLREHRL